MIEERRNWIERWLTSWKEELEHLDTTPASSDPVPALALEVAVSMGLELLREVHPS